MTSYETLRNQLLSHRVSNTESTSELSRAIRIKLLSRYANDATLPAESKTHYVDVLRHTVASLSNDSDAAASTDPLSPPAMWSLQASPSFGIPNSRSWYKGGHGSIGTSMTQDTDLGTDASSSEEDPSSDPSTSDSSATSASGDDEKEETGGSPHVEEEHTASSRGAGGGPSTSATASLASGAVVNASTARGSMAMLRDRAKALFTDARTTMNFIPSVFQPAATTGSLTAVPDCAWPDLESLNNASPDSPYSSQDAALSSADASYLFAPPLMLSLPTTAATNRGGGTGSSGGGGASGVVATSLAFGSTGTLAVGTSGGALYLFANVVGKVCPQLLPTTTGDTTNVARRWQAASLSLADAVELEGHTDSITDIRWSNTASHLLTCSLDRNFIEWDVARRSKLRVLSTKDQPLVVRFFPINNNFFLAGMRAPVLRLFNLSTGMQVKRVKLQCNVGAVEIDTSGQLVFAGDAKGALSVYECCVETGQVERGARLVISDNKPITNICWQPMLIGGAGSAPTSVLTAQGSRDWHWLVINARADAVFVVALLRDRKLGIHLEIRHTIPQAHSTMNLRAALCPTGPPTPVPLGGNTSMPPPLPQQQQAPSSLLPLRFATGSEDGMLRVLNTTPQRWNELSRQPCATTPASALLGVSFDPLGQVLAGVTNKGQLLLWRRLVIVDPESGGVRLLTALGDGSDDATYYYDRLRRAAVVVTPRRRTSSAGTNSSMSGSSKRVGGIDSDRGGGDPSDSGASS